MRGTYRYIRFCPKRIRGIVEDTAVVAATPDALDVAEAMMDDGRLTRRTESSHTTPTSPHPTKSQCDMPRYASPLVSENEYDISTAIAPGIDDVDDSGKDGKQTNGSRGSAGADMPGWTGIKDINDLGAIEHHDEDDDDDYGFIAAQQAASNRKASNLKGRSVKKGGGFQAMGGYLPLS